MTINDAVEGKIKSKAWVGRQPKSCKTGGGLELKVKVFFQ